MNIAEKLLARHGSFVVPFAHEAAERVASSDGCDYYHFSDGSVIKNNQFGQNSIV